MKSKYRTGSKKPSFLRYLAFVMYRIQRTDAFLALLNFSAVIFGLLGLYLTLSAGRKTQHPVDSSLIPHSGNVVILLFALSLVSVLLSFSAVLIGIYRRYVKRQDDRLDRRGAIPIAEVSLTEIGVSNSDKASGFTKSLMKVGNGTEELVFRSKAVDEYLWDNDIVIEEDKLRRSRLYASIESRCDSAAEALRNQFVMSRKMLKQFSNGQKLCLADDIKPDMQTIGCYKGGYYLSFLTNELCTRILVRNDEQHTVVYDGRSLFPVTLYSDKMPYLLLLSTTTMVRAFESIRG
ncbi:hypothetical protein ACFL6S_15725 [Candidatus Poribacteria bacterium]